MAPAGAAKPAPTRVAGATASRRGAPGVPSSGRASSARQRLRLINACISALHIHGPSRTTVEKVVAIAGMSPGIVRFYFATKAAMMVASLQYLATEFEQLVLVPVAQLRQEPVRALLTLVDLYLDPELASPRKVSVWYSFWGEASSRQEYFDICGKKDARFADLVRELIDRLISQTKSEHLDADGVALGLIGVLEMLWQDFAFQSESRIDRVAARRRSLAYLRSVFPGQFERNGASTLLAAAAPSTNGTALPGEAGANGALGGAAGDELHQLMADPGLTASDDSVFAACWQIAAHQVSAPSAGDFVTAELAIGPVLVLRDAGGKLRAWRNQCGRGSHLLVSARRGRLPDVIECPIHGLKWTLQGEPLHERANEALDELSCRVHDGLILVHAGHVAGTTAPSIDLGLAPALVPVADNELSVQAPWQMLVEQWLEFDLPEMPLGRLSGLLLAPDLQLDERSGSALWRARLGGQARSWFARRYAQLAGTSGPAYWQRLFLPPNQLLEQRPDGLTVLQVIPGTSLSAGQLAVDQSRVRWLEYRLPAADRRLLAMNYLARRLHASWLRQDLEAVQSAAHARAASRAERRISPVAVPLTVAALRSVLAATQFRSNRSR